MPDWRVIRAEYVTGEMSMRELCEKYGISESTIRKRAAKEQWVEHRGEHRNTLCHMVEQKVAEQKAQDEAEILAVRDEARRRLWREIVRRVRGAEEMSMSELRQLVRIYCDMLDAEPEGSRDTDAGGVIEIPEVRDG